jgi:hypothetical protein
MPHGHGVDNCSLRFYRKGRKLDLGESRSPTQIFQRNLLPASHRLWAYVCTFGPGLMVMMAMAMVLVMVIIVLRQVGWLRQRQHQSFHRLRALQTQSFPLAKSFPWKTLYLPKRGSLKRGSLKGGSQAGYQAGYQAGFQAGSQAPAGSQADSQR